MAESELEILLRLKDEATDQLNQVNEQLKGLGESGGKVSKSTDDMANTYTGLGRALRSVIPSMGEMKTMMDSSVESSKKLEMGLQGVTQGMNYMILTSKMSAGAMATSMLATQAGGAMISWGVDQLNKYNTQNEVATALQEEFGDVTFVQTDKQRLLAEQYVKITEALPQVSDEGRKYIQTLKDQIKSYDDQTEAFKKNYDAQVKAHNESVEVYNQWKRNITSLDGLKNAYGILTKEESKNSDQLFAIQEYMQTTNVSYEEALVLIDKLTTAYANEYNAIERVRGALMAENAARAGGSAGKGLVTPGETAAGGGARWQAAYNLWASDPNRNWTEKEIYNKTQEMLVDQGINASPKYDIATNSINLVLDGTVIASVTAKELGNSMANRSVTGG